MECGDQITVPVNSKAVLIEPGSFTVVWMNESASRDCPDIDFGAGAGVPIEKAVPMAGVLGVMEAPKAVKETGVARHLHADVKRTGKGSMELAASIYRLPSGELLLLMEDTWKVERRTAGGPVARRRRDRRIR